MLIDKRNVVFVINIKNYYMDISAFELDHFQRKTNFAGWAILIVYENSSLPLNQINVYDGLQGVPDNLSIDLSHYKTHLFGK